MQQATNKIISKVFEGPSGESEYGPWQIYNLYFEGSEKKFSYMQSGKKPVPVKGMNVAFLKYEVEKKGQYTNYQIKSLELADKEIPNNPKLDAPQNGKAYIDHGQCAIALIQMAGGPACDDGVLDLLTDAFIRVIERMTKPPEEKSKEGPEEEPPFIDEEPPPDF